MHTRGTAGWLWLAAAGTASAVGAVVLHVLAGTGLPSDASRTLSVQVPMAAVGLLLLWHRPQNRIGALALTGAALLGVGLLAIGGLRHADAGDHAFGLPQEAAYVVVQLLGWPLTVVWVLALAGFPDGRLPRRSWRRAVAAGVAVHGAVAVGSLLTAASSDLPGFLIGLEVPLSGPLDAPGLHEAFALANKVLLLALPAVALVALVRRMRGAGPVVLQQGKWLLPALGLQLLVHLAFPTTPDPWHGLRGAGEVLVLTAPTILAAATVLSILRYRLWEIDTILSKALVFGLLSAAVSLVFAAVAAAAAVFAGGSNGRVLTAVAVAVVAILASTRPRRRAEQAVRRLVYGERPRGYAVLAGLGESLAASRGSADVAERVVEAVGRGLSVPWASVWLHVGAGPGFLQRVATSSPGGARSTSLSLGESVALRDPPAVRHRDGLDDGLGALLDRLSLDPPAAVASLLMGAELVGLVACGERPGDPVADDDLELLGLIAREAALGLANQRLEAELRRRLAELEHQAEQLRRSRERLVTAQDEERRRVERDLHDGVQAQLVALAAKLHRIANGPDGSGAALRALAGEAEEALFALQDVARGIFPAVLVDQGLPAALRAQVARIPADVALSVGPDARGRLPAAVEAALYFVALEALGNAQKHGGAAAMSVALRVEDGARVVLEVADEGPGFDGSAPIPPGRGLQNMDDRMAAVGGTLVLRTGPGLGTTVRAIVPLTRPPAPGDAGDDGRGTADGTAVQRPGAVSRR